VDFTDLYITR